MLVVLFNAVKVESVPLNFTFFRQHAVGVYPSARSASATLDECAVWSSPSSGLR